eukprot:473697-Rhodomonas_salina.2
MMLGSDVADRMVVAAVTVRLAPGRGHAGEMARALVDHPLDPPALECNADTRATPTLAPPAL